MMKNILIPTTLEQDTVQALKTALAQAAEKQITIILMQLKESPDAASAAFWLRKMQNDLTPSQEAILELCHDMASFHPNCKLSVQQQFSITKPLLRNFMEACEIGLVIVPNSFAQSRKFLDKHFLQLVKKGKTPILQLSPEFGEHAFSKALFIENSQSHIQAADLPKMIGGHFSFRVISQAKFFDEQNHEEMTPILYETINKNGIDLLIETRKPEKMKLFKNNNFTLNETFGLPVLSVCESVN